MTSIITGDIINSRTTKTPEIWLSALKEALSQYGNSPKHWEVYRGDSFQLEIADASKALEAVIAIKAAIKKIKKLDVRMAIGIGTKNYNATHISEANGPVFIASGETLEQLKKNKTSLAIKTSSEKINTELNLYFRLALIAMDNWSTLAADIIGLSFKNNSLSQKKLGALLNIKQSTVSTRLKRASYDEIVALNEMYKVKVAELKNILK